MNNQTSIDFYQSLMQTYMSNSMQFMFENEIIIEPTSFLTIRIKKDSFITKEHLFYICLHNKLSLTIIDKDDNKYTFINGNWSSIEYKEYTLSFEYDSNNNLINRVIKNKYNYEYYKN